MTKLFVTLIIAFSSIQLIYGQAEMAVLVVEDNLDSPQDTLPLLDERQLKSQKWFYNLAEALRDKEQVYKLSLSGQDLREVPPQVFEFPNLQVLNLSDNRLKKVPNEIANLQRLESLNLTHNRLKILPITLRELPHLSHFYISTNRLMEIPAWFGGLAKLRVLEISFNPVTSYEVKLLREKMPKVEIKY